VIDLNLVAQLNADAVELKAPKKVLAHVVARRSLQWFKPEQALGPAMVALVAHVRGLEEEWNPADLILGEEDSEGGETIEQAG